MYNENDSLFSVVFIDLELATQGDSVNEAMSMAREALEGRLYCHVTDGEPIPMPSAGGAHIPEDNSDLITVTVDLDKIIDDLRADYEAK
jgi:predicted RNase H-like HicB family nuclease